MDADACMREVYGEMYIPERAPKVGHSWGRVLGRAQPEEGEIAEARGMTFFCDAPFNYGSGGAHGERQRQQQHVVPGDQAKDSGSPGVQLR